MSLITFEEFLYGISNTARAPFDEKIRLLYLFFEEDLENGIEFKQFVKMLYNYSKQQLKQILVSDNFLTEESHERKIIPKQHSEGNIYEMSAQDDRKTVSAFDEAYESLMKVHDEGTILEVNFNELKYKIKYYNMSTLIKEFAQKVYHSHMINVEKDQRLSYQKFSTWIKSHKKLFKSYYSAFHTDIWAVTDGEPNYLNKKINFEFCGGLRIGKEKQIRQDIYGFQLDDVVIFCQGKRNKKKPIKIVCLEGLCIKDLGNLSIQIAHRSDHYQGCVMIFKKDQDHREWLQNLAIYQRESLNNNYFISDVIGTGKFSIVYRCIEKQSHKVHALKVIQLQKLTKHAREIIKNESEILKILNHPQTLKYVDTIYTKTHEYIITEYIYGEDLFEYVRKRKFLNEFQSAFVIGNIMKAVMYLHQLDIMHRDLKPQNIMVSFMEKVEGEYFECTTPSIRKGQRIQNIKIIDFGLSNHISKLEKMDKQTLAAGTPNYIAPELLLGNQLTLKSDIFSIGSILYFLLKGTLPFAQLNQQKTLMNTVVGKYDLQSEHWQNISPEAKDLLSKLLQTDPEQRIELSDAVNHEWFSLILNKRRKTNVSETSSVSMGQTQQSLKRQLDDLRFEKTCKTRHTSNSYDKYKGQQKTRHSK